jgi:hypothetical protein
MKTRIPYPAEVEHARAQRVAFNELQERLRMAVVQAMDAGERSAFVEEGGNLTPLQKATEIVIAEIREAGWATGHTYTRGGVEITFTPHPRGDVGTVGSGDEDGHAR